MKSYNEQLTALRASGNLRHLPEVDASRNMDIKRGKAYAESLYSNDYLGLASRQDLQEEFQASTQDRFYPYSSSSSRLLTGNFSVYTKLEKQIARSFDREAALIFNSGYHANMGILPAVRRYTKPYTGRTSWCMPASSTASAYPPHAASASATTTWYKLERLLEQHHATFRQLIIVTESIFSNGR